MDMQELRESTPCDFLQVISLKDLQTLLSNLVTKINSQSDNKERESPSFITDEIYKIQLLVRDQLDAQFYL